MGFSWIGMERGWVWSWWAWLHHSCVVLLGSRRVTNREHWVVDVGVQFVFWIVPLVSQRLQESPDPIQRALLPLNLAQRIIRWLWNVRSGYDRYCQAFDWIFQPVPKSTPV